LSSQALINKGNTAWRNKFLRFLGEAYLRAALAEQQALLERCYRLLGQQEERVQALAAENDALKGIVLDQDNPHPWDDPDVRPW
jgi:hypothetical protein